MSRLLPTTVSLALGLALTLALSGCSISKVMRVEDRQVIGVESMIEEVSGVPLVFVGERHNASSHHKLQLEVIKGLVARGKPVAIGMEMFETTSQRALTAWSAGKVPEQAFMRVFEDNWRNISWWLYRDILLYARDHRIPVIALNAPRAVVQKVAQQGFSALGPDELGRLPAGIKGDISDDYVNFMAAAYTGHGRSGSAFRRIFEAQMLRNRVMARQIGDYLALHPERTMVVLAGGGHAREAGGVPAELEKIRYRIVLPTVPGLSADTVTAKDGDYLLEEPFYWLELIF